MKWQKNLGSCSFSVVTTDQLEATWRGKISLALVKMFELCLACSLAPFGLDSSLPRTLQ